MSWLRESRPVKFAVSVIGPVPDTINGRQIKGALWEMGISGVRQRKKVRAVYDANLRFTKESAEAARKQKEALEQALRSGTGAVGSIDPKDKVGRKPKHIVDLTFDERYNNELRRILGSRVEEFRQKEKKFG